MSEVRPEHVELLRRRAAALARVPLRTKREQTFAAVVFQLGDEQYAIDARVVREVAVLRELAPLPRARPPLYGLTYWRGSVVAVVDLREALHVRTHGLTDLSRVIIVDSPTRPFGVLADAARDFMEIEETAIRAVPTDARTSLLRGTLDNAVLVLDVDALMRTCDPVTSGPDAGGRGG